MNNEIKTKKRYRKRYKGNAKIEEEKVKEVNLFVIGEPDEVDTNFTKIFTAFTMRLMRNEKIVGKAVRLLFWIMDNLKMNSLEFYMSWRSVCNDLNISKDTYFKWKKILEEERIIVKLDTNYYMINPACVVKGKGHRLIDSFRKKVEEKAKRDSGQGETTTPEPETPELFSEKNFEEVK